MIQIRRDSKRVYAVVPLTPSKSITNRVFLINALSGNSTPPENISESADSKILRDALTAHRTTIDAKDAGTAFRFLVAYLAIQEGTYILTGSDRMKLRPVGTLVNALRSLGAEIQYLEKENFPPLRITGSKLNGGKITIESPESSQFISSLLMIAPLLPGGLEITFTGSLRSFSYVNMTLALMKHFGIPVMQNANRLRVPEGKYDRRKIIIENDWSSASFWFGIAALSDEAEINLKNLSPDSIQGDSGIAQIMEVFGISTEATGGDLLLRKLSGHPLPRLFDRDFSDTPDLAIPVAFVCAALQVESVFRGVRSLRIKESDRLTALQIELEKVGALLEITEDSFRIRPGKFTRTLPVFHAHNDHRLVMAEAILSLKYGLVEIDDHLPVGKSYPEFWEQLQAAGFNLDIT